MNELTMLLNVDIAETKFTRSEVRNENHSNNSTSNSGCQQRTISNGVVKNVALSAPRIPPIGAAARHPSKDLLPKIIPLLENEKSKPQVGREV